MGGTLGGSMPLFLNGVPIQASLWDWPPTAREGPCVLSKRLDPGVHSPPLPSSSNICGSVPSLPSGSSHLSCPEGQAIAPAATPRLLWCISLVLLPKFQASWAQPWSLCGQRERTQAQMNTCTPTCPMHGFTEHCKGRP